jgi:hypothetical protein
MAVWREGATFYLITGQYDAPGSCEWRSTV